MKKVLILCLILLLVVPLQKVNAEDASDFTISIHAPEFNPKWNVETCCRYELYDISRLVSARLQAETKEAIYQDITNLGVVERRQYLFAEGRLIYKLDAQRDIEASHSVGVSQKDSTRIIAIIGPEAIYKEGNKSWYTAPIFVEVPPADDFGSAEYIDVYPKLYHREGTPQGVIEYPKKPKPNLPQTGQGRTTREYVAVGLVIMGLALILKTKTNRKQNHGGNNETL